MGGVGGGGGGGGGGVEDNSKIIFLISMKTYVVAPQNRLNETVLMRVTKYVFAVKIWIIIPKLSLLSLLIWSTAANSSKEIPHLT